MSLLNLSSITILSFINVYRKIVQNCRNNLILLVTTDVEVQSAWSHGLW